MIIIITVLAAIYFSICPSDRDYLNKVMEEIKVRRHRLLRAPPSMRPAAPRWRRPLPTTACRAARHLRRSRTRRC